MVKEQKCYCRSNWNRRNGSAKVAEILNPLWGKYHYLDGNNCYCRKARIPPQIFSRPKKCIFDCDVDDDGERFPLDQVYEINPKLKKAYKIKSTSLKPCNCNDFHHFDVEKNEKIPRVIYKTSQDYDDTTEQEEVEDRELIDYSDKSKSQDKIKTQTSSEIDYDQKESDDDHDNNITSNLPQNLDRFVSKNGKSTSQDKIKTQTSSEIKYDQEQSDNDHDDDDNDNNITSNLRQNLDRFVSKNGESTSNTKIHPNDDPKYKKHDEKHNGSSSNLEKLKFNSEEVKKKARRSSSGTNLKQLSDFRKDHYFETHSTENLIQTIPEHTCVHRFALDDRFLPEALNTDVYGESRCIICNKPMENPAQNKTDDRIKKSDKNLFPKFYKYGLAPRKIYVGGNGRVKIEMLMKEKQAENYFLECGSKERPDYFNTFALRYQKGVRLP